MKFKHHLIKKYHESKAAPLWKWAVVMFMILALPLFFSFVNMSQTQEAVDVEEEVAN